MQVPERLALIGGSILLSSTLIFTLKGQASAVIPSVGHSISHVFNHINDTKDTSDFDSNYQRAKQNDWTTGSWGTSKYYIDNDQNMYVGSGDLQTSVENAVGSDEVGKIRTLSIMGDVRAPQNSNNLFSVMNGVTTIHGLDRVDMSPANTINSIFSQDYALKSLDLSSWDTSHVTNMEWMLDNMTSLQRLDISSWDTRNVKAYGHLMDYDYQLTNFTLGNNTHLYGAWLPDYTYPDPQGAFPYHNDKWTNGNTTLSSKQFSDKSYQTTLPGTWYKPTINDQNK